jgi:predicted ATPase
LLSLEDESGILTIKGSGGIGKTTTVKKLTVALSQRGYFAGGITFVDCEFIADYERFKYDVASAFHLELAQEFEQDLQAHYDGESRLIILDNTETLQHLDDIEKIKALIAFVCDIMPLWW